MNQPARFTGRPGRLASLGSRFNRLTGRGSGLCRVCAPQHGHGRLSMAAVSYTVHDPASGHECWQLPHETVHVSTIKTPVPSLSRSESRGTRSTPGRSSG